jgi:hypothetical protein
VSDLFGDDQAAAPKSKPARKPSLVDRTGFDWPRKDPRLLELLETLKDKVFHGDSYELSWALCAAVWQMDRAELEQLAHNADDLLRPLAGRPTGRH